MQSSRPGRKRLPSKLATRPRQGERAGPTTPKPGVPSPAPLSNRAERAGKRREAIIEAALDEFIARGFTATRLDDVAKRAGVAKGTIYLHFEDQQALFQELIRTALMPLIGRLAAPPPPGGSDRGAPANFAQPFA